MFDRFVSEITTGCPFSDAVLAGLFLDPRVGCGPARLEGHRLVWDPVQPVRVQLRELSEQTAKWRSRRGLYLVRPTKGPNDAAYSRSLSDERQEVKAVANNGT